MNSRISSVHLGRRAVVYLRQSTRRQVVEHRESTRRQYALSERAMELGWPRENIDVVDDDLGLSGLSAQWRDGFARLVEEVGRGRVGAIFALEIQRLVRSCADGYRLLEFCRLADVVLADEESLFRPADYNDALLLGLKVQMSEAESQWLRSRLVGARLNKAHRGELAFVPPAGYEWDEETRRFRFDPDEGVQSAIRLLFERFRIDASARGVVRYLRQHGLTMPVRNPASHEVRFVPPHVGAVLAVLRNPIYGGAYVYGRSEQRLGLVDGQVRLRYSRKRSPQAWTVCLEQQHPAYITWEDFMANQRKLEDNRKGSDGTAGPVGEGSALLQGLVLCGRCGHRMAVRYCRSGRPIYWCPSGNSQGLAGCWSVAGPRIDAAVAELFLAVAQPPELELSLAVALEVEKSAAELDRQWRLRRERAEYEARHAERRYKAVDPDNRVVARTLEREWEEKLRALEQVERDYQEARERDKLELTEADRVRVLALAKDLSRVWNAETTTHAERKNLLRMLVEAVTLTPLDVPERSTAIAVQWRTGALTRLTIERPGPGRPRSATPTSDSCPPTMTRSDRPGPNEKDAL